MTTIISFGWDKHENRPSIRLNYTGEVANDLSLEFDTLGAGEEEVITRFAIYSNGDGSLDRELIYDSLPEKAQLDWLDSAIQARGYTIEFGGGVGQSRSLNSEERRQLMRVTVDLEDGLKEMR